MPVLMHRYDVKPWHFGGPETFTYRETQFLLDAEEERQREARKQQWLNRARQRRR